MRFSEMTYIKPGIMLNIVEVSSLKAIEVEGKKEVLFNVTLLKKVKDLYRPACYEICGEAFDNSPIEMYVNVDDVEELIEFVTNTKEEPELT